MSTIADQHTSEELIQKIRTRDHVTLKAIYKEVYPMVEGYIKQNNGEATDAQDIFQDAMYLLIKKVEDVNFELTSKLSTFLFGISKNLWLKKLTKKKLDTTSYEVEMELQELADEDYEKLSLTKRMHACIQKLGEPCRTIITQFYFLKASMQEIADKLNYTNANNAKNQKYKCFKRLQKMMLNE